VTDDIVIVCDKLNDQQRDQLLNAVASLKTKGARVRVAWFPDIEGKKDVSDLHSAGLDDGIRDMIANAEEYASDPARHKPEEYVKSSEEPIGLGTSLGFN
jgi:hypothetical protein